MPFLQRQNAVFLTGVFPEGRPGTICLGWIRSIATQCPHPSSLLGLLFSVSLGNISPGTMGRRRFLWFLWDGWKCTMVNRWWPHHAIGRLSEEFSRAMGSCCLGKGVFCVGAMTPNLVRITQVPNWQSDKTLFVDPHKSLSTMLHRLDLFSTN